MLSKLSASEIIESIYSEYGCAMSFERVVRMRHMTFSYGSVIICEEVTRQRNVLHKPYRSEVIQDICSECSFAISFERVARMRRITSGRSLDRGICSLSRPHQKSLEVYALSTVVQ